MDFSASSPARSSVPPLFVVMGVSGSGKSTLARALAENGGWRYLDADDFHPPANVAKMRAGEPLTDADRAGWLESLHERLATAATSGEGVVFACSALRRTYRDALRGPSKLPLCFVVLHGSRHVLEERLNARRNHFMPASLLESQLATLELPDPDEWSLTVDVETPVEAAVTIVSEKTGIGKQA